MRNPTNIKRRRSAIWLLDLEELKTLVKNSGSITEILLFFNLSNKGGNFKTLQKRLKEEGIDYSNIQIGRGSNKGKIFFNSIKLSYKEVLVENSSYNRGHLKKRLLKDGMLHNSCYICGQLPIWNGKPLSLQLDHINGISDDNRLENLRILCPHCHSQTPTFAGKRMKKDRSPTPSELDPNWRKAPRPSTYKVQRPLKEDLEKMLWELPTLQIGKNYGVSDQAVAKWAKSYGLSKPARGYWQKIKKAI